MRARKLLLSLKEGACKKEEREYEIMGNIHCFFLICLATGFCATVVAMEQCHGGHQNGNAVTGAAFFVSNKLSCEDESFLNTGPTTVCRRRPNATFFRWYQIFTGDSLYFVDCRQHQKGTLANVFFYLYRSGFLDPETEASDMFLIKNWELDTEWTHIKNLHRCMLDDTIYDVPPSCLKKAMIMFREEKKAVNRARQKKTKKKFTRERRQKKYHRNGSGCYKKKNR